MENCDSPSRQSGQSHEKIVFVPFFWYRPETFVYFNLYNRNGPEKLLEAWALCELSASQSLDHASLARDLLRLVEIEAHLNPMNLIIFFSRKEESCP